MKKQLPPLENDWRLSEGVFHTLTEEANDAIFLIKSDGVFLYGNRQAVALLGISKEELVKRNYTEFVLPEDHKLAASQIKLVMEGKPNNTEIRVRTNNGEIFLIHFSSVKIVVDGQEILMTIGKDITVRKAAEAVLRNSEENLRGIIREMPDGILVVDSGKISFANLSIVRTLGLSAVEELVGRSPFDFIQPEYRTLVSERIARLIKEGGSNPNIRFKLQRQDGNPVDVESRSILVQFDGKPVVLAIMKDITLRNQMEHQATLNDKLATVGTLAAGVAHEVNNPLSYVLANLVFINEQIEDVKRHLQMNGTFDETCQKTFAEMKGELADITKGGEKIRDIVKGLKAFVRTNEDEVESIDLNQTVEAAINMSFHVVKQKARIEKDFAVDLPRLKANSGKLQQVFINLLINASQAMAGNNRDKNKISIRTGRYDGMVFVEFKDTGVGIPENILPRIFDPFFTTKPIGVGTGLGLSVCNEILRHYGGTLEVQSTLGQGSTFTVNLHIDRANEAAAANSVPPAEKMRGRVLVVDDEPSNLDALCRLLKKYDTVLSALSGLDAMGIIEREVGHIEAILSDINMPDMNGMDLYKNVSRKFPGLEKRIIFITGGVFSEEIKDFLKTIPNPCLEKPFNFEEVRQIIAGVVNESLKNQDGKNAG